MSKTGAVCFQLNDLDYSRFEAIINGLIKNGWSVNKRGNVSFMIGNSYEWVTAPIGEYEEVKRQIKMSICNDLASCIDLIWEENFYAIGVHYLDRENLMISISEEIKRLNNIPVPDFSWYLDNISPLFKVVDVVRISCEFE